MRPADRAGDETRDVAGEVARRMTAEPPVRIGLRVADVHRSAARYASLGFTRFAEIPAAAIPGTTSPGTTSPAAAATEDGPAAGDEIVIVILRRGPLQLTLDALEGLPFPPTDRERATRNGPRGLGAVLGLAVGDVDAAVRACTGFVVLTAPRDAAWGERYAEILDPDGYCWKLFQTSARRSQ
jgi:hypothetical protein